MQLALNASAAAAWLWPTSHSSKTLLATSNQAILFPFSSSLFYSLHVRRKREHVKHFVELELKSRLEWPTHARTRRCCTS